MLFAKIEKIVWRKVFAYQTKPSESLFSSGECRYIRIAKFPYRIAFP